MSLTGGEVEAGANGIVDLLQLYHSALAEAKELEETISAVVKDHKVYYSNKHGKLLRAEYKRFVRLWKEKKRQATKLNKRLTDTAQLQASGKVGKMHTRKRRFSPDCCSSHSGEPSSASDTLAASIDTFSSNSETSSSSGGTSSSHSETSTSSSDISECSDSETSTSSSDISESSDSETSTSSSDISESSDSETSTSSSDISESSDSETSTSSSDISESSDSETSCSSGGTSSSPSETPSSYVDVQPESSYSDQE